MSIFNQVIAGLTGERSLRQTRDRSISAAQKAFDPSVFDPQLDVAREQATQGIDENLYRRNVLNQLFRPVDGSVYGGNQAAAIAGTASVDASRAQAMGQFEGNLAMQDATMRQAGAQQVGQLQSQQLQTQAQREGYMDAIRAEYSAEVDNRRRLLGTSVAKFGIEAAGGAGAIGKALGGKLSGGMGALKSLFANVPEVDFSSLPDVPMGMEGMKDFADSSWDTTFLGKGMRETIAGGIRQYTPGTFDPTQPLGVFSPVVASPVVQQPVTTAPKATPVTATPTFEEFNKTISDKIDPSDRQMNQVTGERIPTLFETLEIDKMVRDTGLPDMLGEGVSFLDRVGKDIMYRANPFIQFRNLQERRAKEREEQLRELYNQRYNQPR
jgi:hypothetical protein